MGDDVAALTARLQRLEDLEAIRCTWLDYCHQLDLGDLYGLGDVFTADAELEMNGLAPSLDGSYQGRARSSTSSTRVPASRRRPRPRLDS